MSCQFSSSLEKSFLCCLICSVSLPKGAVFGRLCYGAFVLMIFANSGFTLFYTHTSMVNYPGGASLARFNYHYENVDNGISSIPQLDVFADCSPVHVHISNLAAQTGASLFLQTHSAPYPPFLPSLTSGQNWTYNKTENLTTYSPSPFTHLIVEASGPLPRGWKKVECIEGLDGWFPMRALSNTKPNAATVGWGTLLTVSRQVLTFDMSDKLCILERS